MCDRLLVTGRDCFGLRGCANYIFGDTIQTIIHEHPTWHDVRSNQAAPSAALRRMLPQKISSTDSFPAATRWRKCGNSNRGRCRLDSSFFTLSVTVPVLIGILLCLAGSATVHPVVAGILLLAAALVIGEIHLRGTRARLFLVICSPH